MIISHKHEFILLTTKNTFAAEIEAVLHPHLALDDVCTLARQHARLGSMSDWKEIQRVVTPEQWNKYHKFTFERNPFEKTVVDYKFKKQYALCSEDFSKYLDEWVRPGRMSDWDAYSYNDNPVFQVIQFDLIPTFLSTFCQMHEINLNRELNIAKLNPPYGSYYKNLGQIHIVEEAFATEIAYFNYGFDPTGCEWFYQ